MDNQITQWKMLILGYTITGTAAYIIKNKKKGGGGCHITVKLQLLTCTPLVASLFRMSAFGRVLVCYLTLELKLCCRNFMNFFPILSFLYASQHFYRFVNAHKR